MDGHPKLAALLFLTVGGKTHTCHIPSYTVYIIPAKSDALCVRLTLADYKRRQSDSSRTVSHA